MRKYPRTAEDREAIAAARRRHYAMQAARCEARAQEEQQRTDSNTGNGDKDPPETDPNDVGAHKNPADTHNPGAGANTAQPNAASVEIPADYAKLDWPNLRALAKQLTTQHVISKVEACSVIEAELARRAAAAANE